MTTIATPPHVDKETNPWESQRARFDLAAQKLNLDEGLWRVLRYPNREVTVYIPVQMDDGHLEVRPFRSLGLHQVADVREILNHRIRDATANRPRDDCVSELQPEKVSRVGPRIDARDDVETLEGKERQALHEVRTTAARDTLVSTAAGRAREFHARSWALLKNRDPCLSVQIPRVLIGRAPHEEEFG